MVSKKHSGAAAVTPGISRNQSIIWCDYLVIGTGASGLAFVDSMVGSTSHSGPTFVMVDKRLTPGGHWVDTYPFVTLHAPAHYYGVPSKKLESFQDIVAVDIEDPVQSGLQKVNTSAMTHSPSELAPGYRVANYFKEVMVDLEQSGRVRHWGGREYLGKIEKSTSERHSGFSRHNVRDLLTNKVFVVIVRKKVVDATYLEASIPSVSKCKFPVSPGVNIIPVNTLFTKKVNGKTNFTIIGAGKTGIDAILFLLARGLDPDKIRWIMPNDAWLLNRENMDPTSASYNDLVYFEALLSNSVDTFSSYFPELERRGHISRLDPKITPTKWRCATVSPDELDDLRSIKNVIRQGRVLCVTPTSMNMEKDIHGLSIENHILVDCTSNGLPAKPVIPIFQEDKIVLQSLIMCQPIGSAAIIGRAEAVMKSEDRNVEKNSLFLPCSSPEMIRDFIPAMLRSLRTQLLIGSIKGVGSWWRRCRLNIESHSDIKTNMKFMLRMHEILIMMDNGSKKLQKFHVEEFGKFVDFEMWPEGFQTPSEIARVVRIYQVFVLCVLVGLIVILMITSA